MVGFMILALAAGPGGMPAHDVPIVHPRVGVARAVPADEILKSPERRIRAMDQRVARLLSDGVRRSTTFAALVSALQGTDVIVYIEANNHLPARLGGRLLLQAVTERERYVRVQVRAALPPNQAIEVIAHELQHAIEVAQNPSVVDEKGLLDLYQRIGYLSFEDRGFDTRAAKRTGEIVRQELRG